MLARVFFCMDVEFENSLQILNGITFKLFAVTLMYINDIEDDEIAYLDPKEYKSKEEIRAFFQERLDLSYKRI